MKIVERDAVFGGSFIGALDVDPSGFELGVLPAAASRERSSSRTEPEEQPRCHRAEHDHQEQLVGPGRNPR